MLPHEVRPNQSVYEPTDGEAIKRWGRSSFQYSGADERPLGSYALLLAIYGVLVGAMVTADMLLVATYELRHPVTHMVKVVTADRPFH